MTQAADKSGRAAAPGRPRSHPAAPGVGPGSGRPSPATPSTARAINDRAALDLFAARGPLTTLDLAQATGLAKPTVAELLARLQDEGLVEPAGEVRNDKRGPNAKLYALAAGRATVAGIDARTEVVHLSVADLAGRTLAEITVRIPPDLPPDEVPDLLADELLALAGQPHVGQSHIGKSHIGKSRDGESRDGRAVNELAAPLLAVTIGMPGLVNPTTGRLGPTPVGPLWHQRLAAAVGERMGLDQASVVLENEVNLAAIAEHRLLADQGIDTFALLWLDAGVGAAIVLDGRLRRGATGGAGEIGFLAVPGARSRIDPDSAAGGMCDLLDAQALTALTEHLPAADRLDAIAGKVVFAVAAFALTLDPGVVVLGGANGVAGGAELAALVERRLPEICPVPARILPTIVPGNPILAGAVATALDRARALLWP